PSASAPSRIARGTVRRNSSVLRSVMGIIIKPSANPPASVEKCLNGSTTTLYAKIPITMEGTPFNRSATYRTTNPIVLPPNSASPAGASCRIHCAAAPRGHKDQQPRETIQEEGDQEQNQAELNQRTQVQVAGSLREFVGDDRCDRVARREKRSADLRVVADHH